MSKLWGALAVAFVAASTFVLVPMEATAASSYLDPAFGDEGISQLGAPLIDVPASVGVADSVRMPDGRIVVAGTTSAVPCQVGAWWIGRFNADGSVDTTFGSGGRGWVVVTPSQIPSCPQSPYAPIQLRSVAVQSTGKILLAGAPNLVLMRLNVNGTVDTGFTPTRRQLPGQTNYNWPQTCLPDFDKTGGRIWDMTVTADDRIIVAGSVARQLEPPRVACPNGVWRQGPAVLRYQADGTGLTELPAPWGSSTTERAVERLALLVDETVVAATDTALHWLGAVQVSVAGAVTVDGENGTPIGLATDPDDRAVLGVTTAGGSQVAVRRFDAAGAPDAAFAAGGEWRSTGSSVFTRLTADGAGRVLLSGISGERTADVHLIRLDGAGGLDPSFGVGGAITHRPARGLLPTTPQVRSVEVGTDGRIRVLATAPTALVLGELLPDGSADTAFEPDGFRWVDSPVTTRRERGIQIGDLAVLPAGETVAVLGQDIVRWRADGSVDTSFADNGRLVAPVGTQFRRLRAHGGRLVVVGTNGADGTESEASFIGRYDAATGAPDPTFGTDGFVTLVDDGITSVAVDPLGRVLAALEPSSSTAPQLPALVRFDATGEQDPTFGDAGRALTDLYAHVAAVDGGGRVLVTGIVRSDGTPTLVRLTADGAPDPTFATTALPSYADGLHVVADGHILARYSRASVTRVLADGGVDSTYAGDGTLEAGQDTYPVGLSVDPLGRVLLSGANLTTDDVVVRRYTDDGAVDTTFASGGSARVRVPLPPDIQHSGPTGGGGGSGLDASGGLIVGFHAGYFGQPSQQQLVSLLRFPADPPADTIPPEVSIVVPVDGATYRNDVIPPLADFACSDADSGLDTCTGSTAAGTYIPMSPGTNTFSATGTDLAGLTTSVTATYDVLDAVTTEIPAGTSTSTGEMPTANDPLETTVQTPNAGPVTILEQPLTTPTAGYRLLDWESVVTAPVATAADPLRLTFWLDATVLGALDAGTLEVLRNGTPVPACAEAEVTAPDPCITERSTLPDGDARIVVLTSAASTWAFGELADGTPPTITVERPANGAQFSLGQTVTASYSCTDADSGVSGCTGSVPSGSALATSAAGTFPFVVDATDAAGNTAQSSGTYQVLAGSVTATVAGPAIVTTDPGDVGASAQVPVQTRLAVPTGASGAYAIASRAAGTPPSGYVLFATAVDTSGPAAPGASSPYELSFTLDAGEVAPVSAEQVAVLRGSTPVTPCGGADAAPDPCIASRVTAPNGDVTLTVLTTQLGAWSFGRRAFIVYGATPPARAQGTSAQTVVIAGAGFVGTTAAKFSGSGVSVASITRTATSLQLTVNVGAGAAPGPRDVIVTNPGAVVATCAGCFTVTPRPTIGTVTPSSRPRGAANVIVQVAGTGFQDGAAAVVGGTGVTVHRVVFSSPTRLDLEVSIDPAAATGARAVTVTNPDGGTGTKAGAFVVNVLPTITAATPSQLRAGQTVTVAVTGSGFPADFVAAGGTVTFGDGLTVQSVVRTSASKLTASVAVDPAASTGPRGVTVVNPDGGTATCTGCAIVVADPQVAAVAPALHARGASNRTVTISGSGFQAGAVVRFSGSGVTVASATVVDAATISAVITVGGSATLGARDVTITNPDTGTATCTACITVNPRPTITSLVPASGGRGATGLSVQLNGTGLQPGMTVTVAGTGVSATVVSATPTAATLLIDVATDAATGQRAVTVTNPDTGAVTRNNSFRVT